jgi:hypothetical protein
MVAETCNIDWVFSNKEQCWIASNWDLYVQNTKQDASNKVSRRRFNQTIGCASNWYCDQHVE